MSQRENIEAFLNEMASRLGAPRHELKITDMVTENSDYSACKFCGSKESIKIRFYSCGQDTNGYLYACADRIACEANRNAGLDEINKAIVPLTNGGNQ